MFRKQNADLLIIMSKAGLGKTTLLKEIMKGREYVYINTHSTVLKTYVDLYDKRDVPVAFDDLSSILQNSTMVSLLKSLADTSPIKELHYNTTSKLIGNAPESFKTTSNVCILLNEFDIRNKSLEPLLDRSFYISFTPSKKEILKKIKEISKNSMDNEKCVLDFIEENYQKIENFSLRTYIKAIQLYNDNPKSWKEKVMKMIGFDEKLVEYLKLTDKYSKVDDMIRNYKWSRATFFRIKSEFDEN